jgi:glycosyltransferase involved in cell wall biosynthesis
MKILLIADAVVSVPPAGYGGTERIIDILARELQQRGHTVDLIAKDGSKRYGGRLICHRAPSKQYPSRAYRKLLFQGLSCVSGRRADVVHSFARSDYLWGLYRSNIPLVLHFQNPVTQSECDGIVTRRRQRIHFIGVSHSQMSQIDCPVPVSVVHNATEFAASAHERNVVQRKYLAFLGRLTPNKGVDTAVQVALKTGYPLRIAGNVPRESGAQAFFDERVRPHLGRQIEWIGEIGDGEKAEFFGGALGLLFPIRWPEPFGIVISEALAHGVPVIAARTASTPELIRHGETGFLCDTEEEIVASVQRLGEICPETCRADAVNRFSPRALTDAVLKVYESVALN